MTFGSDSWTARGPPLSASVTGTEEQLDGQEGARGCPVPSMELLLSTLQGMELLLSTLQGFGLVPCDGNLLSHQSIGSPG